MRVLVTGTEGYIGSLLGPMLAKRGHDVVGIDACFYRTRPLYDLDAAAPRTAREDIRKIGPEYLEGMDAVVHLAELSNDPLGQLAPTITYEVNHQGSVRLARLARERGVPRFVYASSCSVYGIAEQEVVDEESPLHPQTAYAECKELVERDVSALADDSFSPTFLRNATAYGASPRMRFDIVLNNLSAHAWTSGIVRLDSDGTPWRPLVHAEDICRAVIAALEAPRDQVHNQILNVGAPGANYRISELAKVVANAFPGSDVSLGTRGGDTRSYRVSFDKIRAMLPGFQPQWDIDRGAAQLHDVFEQVSLTLEQFEGRDYVRLRQIEFLLSSGQIDEAFYWRATASAQPSAQ
jgi:nucleoside-diphosphate-sugar epimerase